MKDLKEVFKNKKITQMGLGLLGRGIGDASFLAKHGAKLIVTDIKTEEELQDALSTLKDFKNIEFHLGGHTEGDFIDRDLILKGPSVPLGSTYIQIARKNGVPVDMSASLFARIAQIPMIGITGTRGKSTVTDVLHRILTEDERSVVLGGNVRGVSNLSLLEHVKEDSIGVFELDSWQCQGFREEKSLEHPKVKRGLQSPEIAVFTTFMPDHMNYYKGDMDAYLSDKAQIFLHQTSSDTLVLGRQALPALQKCKREIKAHVIVVDENDVPQKWNVPLIGLHNRYNIGVAVAVARVLGIDEPIIQRAVESVRPIPGRLELIREINGIKIFNDTNATTPDATIAALRALNTDNKRNVVLIAGGSNKELDTSSFLPAIHENTKKVFYLKGEGTERLLENDESSKVFGSLRDAVEQAYAVAETGDSLILSPGFASFGMFKNEFDRGEQFNEIVKDLK